MGIGRIRVHGFSQEYRWLAHRFEEHGGVELLCLPHLSCTSVEFHRWPRQVGNVRIRVLRYPADRDPGWWLEHGTFQAQAADLVDELAYSLPRRFALFGHGDAALLAYEVAAELARQRLSAPARLIVSGCPAPQNARVDAPMPTDDEFAEEVLISCLVIGSNPLPSLLEVSANALRVQAMARRSYRITYPKRLDCLITAVSWTSAGEEAEMSAMLGWSECGDTTLVTLEGAKYHYANAPPDLLRIIETCDGEQEQDEKG